MKLKILIILLGAAMAISGIALAWSGTHGAARRITNAGGSSGFEQFSENLFAPFINAPAARRSTLSD